MRVMTNDGFRPKVAMRGRLSPYRNCRVGWCLRLLGNLDVMSVSDYQH